MGTGTSAPHRVHILVPAGYKLPEDLLESGYLQTFSGEFSEKNQLFFRMAEMILDEYRNRMRRIRYGTDPGEVISVLSEFRKPSTTIWF